MLRREARAVLRLGPDYQPAELEAAFRQQARLTHPDHGGDAETFAAVVEAHRILTTVSPAPGNVVFAVERPRLKRLSDKLRRRNPKRDPRVV